MMQVVEGVRTDSSYGLITGAVTIESQTVLAEWEREPSGHMFRQIRLEYTCWFHPYNGGPPRRCMYPKERTTRCL